MNAVVAERGQVTIPKSLRDRLGITPHTVVDFEEDAGRLILTKVLDRDPVSRVLGCLRLDRSSDAILNELRGGS
jgi:AbrB family looped-hinge helix DNA binding protein